MQFSTKKIGAAAYRVYADDRPTSIVIEKDESSPRFGARQRWAIGTYREDGAVIWLCSGQPGKGYALDVVASIATAIEESRG